MKIRQLKKIAALLFSFAFCCFAAFPRQAQAASDLVSVALSSSSPTPGSTVTATVSFSSSKPLMAVQTTVSYSSDVVELVSCAVVSATAIGPQSNNIVITWDSSSAAASATLVRLTLKVKSSAPVGSIGKIFVSNNIAADANNNSVSLAGSSAQVTIKAAASASSKPPATSSRPTAGSKASLASLSFAETDLNRAFSATVTEYSATVANTVTALTVNAKATDSDAKVTVSGNKNLKVGINYVIVKVTAPSGATRQYNITVTRQAAGSSSVTGGSSQSAASSAHSSTAAGHPTSSDGSSVNTSDSSVDSAGEEDLSSETNPSSAASEADISSEEEHIHEDAPDFSEWVIHVAYIGGMIICLLLGCMLGYYIRGRKEV